MTQDQMNSKLHNHKKPLNRHFRSPPMSEASKTAVRGKNILGERNGTDSNSGRSSLGISSQSCASGSNDDEQNSSFVADSSSNQYDPLTNYLSPRPKYLRYKPNRRREILLHLENRGEGNDGLGVERSISVETKESVGHAQDSSPMPPQEVNVQPENDEILKKGDGDDHSPLPSQEGNAEPENDKIPENEDADDDNDEAVDSEEEDEDDVEEEEEEYFEDNGRSFNWLLKLLLLMVIVFLSPLFASLMDYPLSLPTELGVVPLDVNRSISDSQNKIEASTSSFWELDQGEVGIQPDDEVELAEDEEDIFSGSSIELVEVAGPENGLNEGSDQELEKEHTEADMVDDKEAEAFDHLPILEPNENKVDAVSAVENDGFGLLKTHKAFDKTDDSREDHENLEISESLAIPNAPSGDENFATVIQEFDQMNDENEVIPVEPTSKESLGETVLETQMERDEDTDDKISVPGCMAAAYSEESDSSNSDGAENSIYLKLQQIGPTPAALAIASILSLILAYAISIYSARKARTSRKHSNPVVEPPQQSNKAEILTAVIPNVEIAHVEDDDVDGKRESIAKVSSSSFYPIEETSKDHHPRCTPKLFPQLEISSRVETATQDTIQLHNVYSTEASSLARSVRDSSVEFSHTKSLGVELLGELVIGEVSSSLRTHARKTRLPETEESSSNSFSRVSGSRLPPLQPSAFLDSQTSESSYGKKLVKKEGGKDGEAKKVITTPVRRSSRIRSRGTVMSP
nr:Protein Ycf2 like [Ipomoea batatas]